MALDSHAASGAASRRRAAYAALIGLFLYAAGLIAADEPTAVLINNGVWLLASGVAAALCFQTARRVESDRRSAWRFFGAACACWFTGQLHWAYAQIILGEEFPFPSISQLFFIGFPLLVIVGVLRLPETRGKGSFTPEHAGNLGLLICCLMMTLTLGMLDPALRVRAPSLYLWFGVGYTLLVAASPLTAFYALWTYRWNSSLTPLILIVAGVTVYAISDLTLFHLALIGEYRARQLINVGWYVLFACVACAAHEQTWSSTYGHSAPPAWLEQREHWLRAVVPALLIIVMVGVAVSSARYLSPLALYSSAVLFVLFAIILAARETWLQNESKRLTNELVAVNERLRAANADLTRSEGRYRELTVALEQRVQSRTAELRRAYDELESFSYAVAHDLKAPLRVIDGFSRVLAEDGEHQLDSSGKQQLGRIREGVQRMSTLIDDLLAYFKVEMSDEERRTVDLRQIVDEVADAYSEEVQRRGVSFEIDVPRLSLNVNEKGFILALRNLVENALKYTRRSPAPRILIRAEPVDRSIRLAVQDNGVGFDMAHHDQMFKIFKRLHREEEYPGTGIGLALVRKAIERMNGRVWAVSRPGEGATFFIELPLEAPALTNRETSLLDAAERQ